jgi:hypothetical protein
MNHAPSSFAVERAMSAAMSLILSLGPDPEDELVLDSLEGETDVLDVVRRIIRSALEMESMAEAAKAREADLATRRARFEANAERARETVKQMLDALGVNRLQSEDFTVSLKLGPPKVIVTDPDALPAEFVRTVRSPDKTAIKAALDAGRGVPGALTSNGSLVLAVRTR